MVASLSDAGCNSWSSLGRFTQFPKSFSEAHVMILEVDECYDKIRPFNFTKKAWLAPHANVEGDLDVQYIPTYGKKLPQSSSCDNLLNV